MESEAAAIIDHLGGVTKVANLIKAPVSTVFAWKKSGTIPQARKDHLRLAALAAGLPLPDALKAAA